MNVLAEASEVAEAEKSKNPGSAFVFAVGMAEVYLTDRLSWFRLRRGRESYAPRHSLNRVSQNHASRPSHDDGGSYSCRRFGRGPRASCGRPRGHSCVSGEGNMASEDGLPRLRRLRGGKND